MSIGLEGLYALASKRRGMLERPLQPPGKRACRDCPAACLYQPLNALVASGPEALRATWLAAAWCHCNPARACRGVVDFFATHGSNEQRFKGLLQEGSP